MSKIKKNIETCRGEDVLAEVSALPQDPHFGSLVNEALDPLKQQAAAQEGWDGYSEVIAQHKPYTFASAIIQMKSNLLLLLRALWQFPFGSGTLRSLSDAASLRSLSDAASLRSLSDDASLRSLADMWSHYIDRLHGSETYGIPSRLSSLTDLPSAPLLLADRKISEPNAIDGISLIQQICGSASDDITELKDSNEGWIMTKALSSSQFPNVEKLTINAVASLGPTVLFSGFSHLKTLVIDEIEDIRFDAPNNNAWCGILAGCDSIETLYIPKLKKHRRGSAGGYPGGFIAQGCASLKYVIVPVLDSFFNSNAASGVVYNCNSLELFYTPTIYLENISYGISWTNCPSLIRIDTKGAISSVSLSGWNPTNALDASLDTLVTDEDCHNNLEQFLKNFRTYIALRLAEQPVGNPNNKTLTLSQAVYDAIENESHLFVFDEGTMTIYAYLTNIKHWTVTK